MTPPVPRGSSLGSSTQISDPTRAHPTAPAGTDLPAIAPLRLSLDASYLAAGQAGVPFRGGFLLSYRPTSIIGLGAHLDTNFTDQFTATARFEGIWPIHRYLHLEGSVELGVRALFNQNQSVLGRDQPLSGALFTFGGEIAVTSPFLDFFGVSLFLRAFYSPAGGLSSAQPADANAPPRGVEAGGGEVLVGLRINLEPFRPARSVPEPEPQAARSPETTPPPAREALRDFTSAVDSLLTETPAEPTSHDAVPAVPSPRDASESVDAATDAPVPAAVSGRREAILALQRELRTLTGSVSALESEIDAATRIYNDLSQGQETGQPFHIRLDGFYNDLTGHPPRLDLVGLNSFLAEFRGSLRDNDPLRLLIQSDSENFGPNLLQNLQVFRDALTRYQHRLPVHPARGALARGDLDQPLTQLGALLAEYEALRQHPEPTQPPAAQISLWRTRLDRIREHIEQLAPQLPATSRRQLDTQRERLESSFEALMARRDEARDLWMVSRALFSHYQSFRTTRRPEQALAALRGILTELRGAPESYRRLRQRNLATLQSALTEFLQRQSAHPVAAWATSREAAAEILHWIDPNYRPPAIASTPTTPRRPSSHRSQTTSRHASSSGDGNPSDE